MENWFHFDPIQVVLIVASAVTIWTQLRSSVKWHSEWIKKHDRECDELRSSQKGINEKLTVLVDTHCDRLERLENWRDKQ